MSAPRASRPPPFQPRFTLGLFYLAGFFFLYCLVLIAPEANILDDLGADSLDVVELVMAIEDEFDIEVPDEAAEAIRTIADVERYVAEHAS